VRDEKAQGMLPEAEREEWKQFWAEAADLLGRLDEKKPSGA
jgi:hypothetical protein